MLPPNVTTTECAEAVIEALLPPLCAWVGSGIISIPHVEQWSTAVMNTIKTGTTGNLFKRATIKSIE